MKKVLQILRGFAFAAAMTVAAQVSAAPAYTITPEDGAEVESLASVTIAYASDATVTITDESAIELMNYDNGNTYAYSVSINPRRPYQVVIQLNEAVTEEGTVGLFIPSGTFSVSGEESGEIDAAFTVKKAEVVEPEPEPEPEPVDPLQVIKMNPAPGVVASVGAWNLVISSEFALEDRTAKFTLTCSNPDVVIPTLKNRNSMSGAEIYLEDDAVLTQPGVYTLTVPAGRYSVGAESVKVLNPEMKFEYTIEESETPGSTIDPAFSMNPAPGTVSSVGAWNLTINGDFSLGDRTAKFTIECSNPNVSLPALKNRTTGTGVSLYFDGDAVLTEPGIYTLTVPAGRFLLGADETPNAESKFVYEIKSAADLDKLYQGSMKVDPAEGVVEEIEMFLVEFDSNVTLADKTKVSVTGPDGAVPTMADVTDNYLQVFITNDEYLLTAPGKYTLSLGEGAVEVDGKANPAVSFNFTIDGDEPVAPLPSYTVSPKPGTYKTIADGIEIAFSTEETITVDTKGISMSGPDGNLDIFVQTPNRMSQKIVVAQIDGNGEVIPFNTPGNYSLVIAARAINVGSTYNVEPIVLNYTIQSSQQEAWSGEFTADPADDSEVESLKQISITFEGATSVATSSTAGPNDFPALFDNDGKKITGAVGHINVNVLSLTLNQEVTTPGYYTLVIPAAYLSVNGQQLTEPLYVAYTIKEKEVDVEYSYEFEPASKILAPLCSITLTFSGEGLTEVTHNSFAWGNSAPKFTSAENNYCPNFTVSKLTNFTYRWINTYEFKTEGDYTFNVPAEYFTLTFADGTVVKNKAFSEVFSVKTSGVENVSVDRNASTDVYNAQGMLLIKAATAEQLNSLAPGLYIIGGKKVLK